MQSTKGWFQILLENNPGIGTILITALLLPLFMLWLNNRHQRKMKELEKELDVKYSSTEDLRLQEKRVYASLSKILFDVQQLYVALSGSCVDKDCINNAVKRFDESITKYHDQISDNLLYLSSEVINKIYTFYNQVSDLKIDLMELNDNNNFEMAHVCVFQSSENLANTVIDLQEKLVKKRTNIQVDFDRSKQEMMKYCCGRMPPKDVIEQYKKLREQMKTQTI
jgi:Mg2+ and Co2+ transporter CorA